MPIITTRPAATSDAPVRRGSRAAALLSAAAVAVLALGACSSSGSGGGGGSSSVNIVAFSVPKPAYDELETEFAKTDAGKGVQFSASYGPSGSQATSVTSGAPADYVGFSLEPDMNKLVPAFVADTWSSGKTKGIVSSSVVVICVRKGNPKGIKTWDDLIKPGVKIITPDPATSGSAKWNILAAYEHVIATGGSPSDAQAYLTALFKNIVSKPSSGSDAATTFTNGTGDVLVSYENEAIAARQKGADLDYVVPDQTMLIQNPGAVTKKAPAAAKAFLDYVQSDAGQKVFAKHGFRPLNGVDAGTVQGANDPSNPFPTPAKLITVSSLGGWEKVNTEFFDDTSGIVTKIEAAVG